VISLGLSAQWSGVSVDDHRQFSWVLSLLLAIYLVTGSESASVTSPQFEMLSYLDSRVAAQDDVKDGSW